MFPTWHDAANKLYFAVKSTFPETFGLRAYPGHSFRISDSASYYAGPLEAKEVEEHHIMLYTERLRADGTWSDFVKGTPEELRRAIQHQT